jgi:hypothetical protein
MFDAWVTVFHSGVECKLVFIARDQEGHNEGLILYGAFTRAKTSSVATDDCCIGAD